MKLTFSKEELEEYRERYANGQTVVGYSQKERWLRGRLPTYYVLVIGQERLTLIQQDWKLVEQGVTQLNLPDIQTIKISKFLLLHRVTIHTASQTFKLRVLPLNLVLGDYQKALVARLKQLVK